MMRVRVQVADAAGAAVVEVVVDARPHGTQSLLAAGLARTQGAAVCAHIPGGSLVRTPRCPSR